ncbi:MAG: MFS transporter [Acidimicrobiia bacterium]|nr:MFS transporter [Acidimicrobiia bacterium]
MTVMMAFGVILYGFSIFVTDTAAGARFSKTTLSLAYGGSVVVGGILAFPIGAWADRRGVRSILITGGACAAAGMIGFGAAQNPWHVIGAWWLLIGPASAMLFYEVAFIALDQWCSPQDRPRALGLVTLIGGLAGIIFIPGTEWLVTMIGWRWTAVLLGSLVLATALATSFGTLHRTAPPPASQPRRQQRLRRRLLGDRRFTIHTAAMVLVFFSVQGLFAHRVAVFEESGFDLRVVAAWAALASALSLPGRWIAPLVAKRLGAPNLQATTTAMLSIATAMMLGAVAQWQMAGHFVLFGLAFGAFLPLRAMTMSEWFSGSSYGATMGSQWTVVTILGALGPVVTGLLRDATGDYTTAMLTLGTALALAVALLLVVSRLDRPATPDQPRSPG